MSSHAWPRARPDIMHSATDHKVAILAALSDAYRCSRALYTLVFQSTESDATGASVACVGPGAGADGWPCDLPPLLETRDDFMQLAVACRALEAWSDEVDWDLQSRASYAVDPTTRHALESGGWQMTRCAKNALHLVALAVGAAGGVWARDAALQVLRVMGADLVVAMEAIR